MFGSNANHLAHMVKKHQWEKINKSLPNADAQAKTALALACGDSTDEVAPTVLISLLTDGDEGVQLQAVKSLGEIGRESAKTHLQWLSSNLTGERKELRDAISEAFSKISKRK